MGDPRDHDGRNTQRTGLQDEIGQERERRRWLASAPEHRRLTELLARLDVELEDLEHERRKHQASGAALQEQLLEAKGDVVRMEERMQHAQEQGATAEERLEQLASKLRVAEASVARTRSALPDRVSSEARELGEKQTPAFLSSQIEDAELRLSQFTEVERDENLPTNVETLEKQVDAVRSELERLAGQVEEARLAAERAHDQYKAATRRVFRHYFALLEDAGRPLGFRLEGAPRPREDGRFAIDLQVAAGDKALVPYSSPSLSGGQKAALSMLMAMTTLRVHDEDGRAGFFLVDEPFSASDTHKIQELGAFPASTGAQYLVSMPTTEELRRCGAWLQAVLTCTQTRGGRREDGTLRLAPPVKCSYVVDRGQ